MSEKIINSYWIKSPQGNSSRAKLKKSILHKMLREVIYCGICSYPPEYCEFSGKLKRCKVWLSENHADLYAKLYGTDDNTQEVEAVTNKLAESSIGEAREEKLEKDLLKILKKTGKQGTKRIS